MHEVKVSVPVERSRAVAQIAIHAGIPNVSVYRVFVYGTERHEDVLTVEVSTPKAKAFIDALLSSPVFDVDECSITSRELRAIVNRQPLEQITQPLVEPAPDVIEDLWQMSHVTLGYLARAAAGAVLLAEGVIHNSAISIVVAALFLPFLSQVLAVAFGIWCGDRKLIRKGAQALLTSAVLAYCGGVVVAMLTGGPIKFQDFKDPLPSLAISLVIGIAAGLSISDDAGRRYLIGVAAAVQFAIFPVWFGAASVIGLPARVVLGSRIESFLINVVTIGAAAVVSYALLGLNRQELRRFIWPRHSSQPGR